MDDHNMSIDYVYANCFAIEVRRLEHYFCTTWWWMVKYGYQIA
jgi:hypothetical protein